ncbi:MAG: glycoside hydrolase family 36 protein [Acholeplasmataceae bacterium]
MRANIEYRIAGRTLSTSESNADLVIEREVLPIEHGIEVALTVIPKKRITLISASLAEELRYDESTRFMPNGYQSWTETKLYRPSERMRGLDHVPRPLIASYQLDQYGDTNYTTYRKKLLHGYTYAYRIDGYHELIGSLNDHRAFLIIYYDLKKGELRLESDVSKRMIESPFKVFHFIRVQGTHDEVFASYLKRLPRIGERPILTGYTSWYRHGQNIDQEKLMADLEEGDPDDQLFQIDDGYQQAIGDWLSVDPDRFPGGLMPLVARIEEKGRLPGIWLAPFVCEKKSRLFAEKSEYLLKDEHGNPVMAGSNWSGFYALDMTRKDVKDHLKRVLRQMVETYRFKFFKLDFLYAAALLARPDRTRAEAMRESMEFLRETLHDVYILGCGMPLASGFGLVDYARIGPDVSLTFDDAFYMRWLHRERISTKRTILNTIYRRELNGHVFYNDPDVFILRKEDNRLKDAQKEALTLINAIFGHLFLTSDRVRMLDSKAKRILIEAKESLQAKSVTVEQRAGVIAVHYRVNGIEKGFIYRIRSGRIRRLYEGT